MSRRVPPRPPHRLRSDQKPEPGTRPTGSPDDRPILRKEDVERCMHTLIEEQAVRDGLTREGQTFKWLRENWPWWARWAIGYPRAIAALDRLGLVTMPVFVAGHVIGEFTQQLKTSTDPDDDDVCMRCGNSAMDRDYGGCEHCREPHQPEETR